MHTLMDQIWSGSDLSMRRRKAMEESHARVVGRRDRLNGYFVVWPRGALLQPGTRHVQVVVPGWIGHYRGGGVHSGGWSPAASSVGLLRALGGPNPTDSPESTFAKSMAIGHGQLACSYPPGNAIALPSLISPLYPLMSGAIQALTGFGRNLKFPPQAALGQNCSTAMQHAHLYGTVPMLQIGFLGWIALLAGVVALLRACGRGRCVWEPAILLFVACLPSVLLTLTDAFHPQDMLAMGLALGGLACARRGLWIWAGVLLGLAITSRPFALLVFVPLLVVVPNNRRIRFALAAAVAAAFIVVPLVVVASGDALKWAILGSGTGAPDGSTLIGKFPIHGLTVIGSRVLPIALSILLAWWAMRRLGEAVLEPLPLVSLIATYYAYGWSSKTTCSGTTPWLWPCRWSSCVSFVAGSVWGWWGWLGLVALAFPLPWGSSDAIALWIWQMLILCSGIALAAAPLVSAARVARQDSLSRWVGKGVLAGDC